MGLVCPNCRVLCRGASALEFHLASCEGGPSNEHDAPGGHIVTGSVIVTLFTFMCYSFSSVCLYFIINITKMGPFSLLVVCV